LSVALVTPTLSLIFAVTTGLQLSVLLTVIAPKTGFVVSGFVGFVGVTGATGVTGVTGVTTVGLGTVTTGHAVPTGRVEIAG
jgi:hypothetical protein